MVRVARSVLGFSSSSTSVERVFSGSGNVTDPHRGSLSSKALSQQTSTKYWLRQFPDVPVLVSAQDKKSAAVKKLDPKGKGKGKQVECLVLDSE